MSRGTVNVPIAAVLVRRDGKLLFVRRAHTDYLNGYYALPSGHVEDRESFSEAACRELLEEVGLQVRPDQLRIAIVTHERHPDDVRVAVVFELVSWEGEPYNAEPKVHDEMVWLDPDNLPGMVMPTAVFALDQLKAGKTYAEYGWDVPPTT